VNNFKTEAEIV